MAFVIHPPWFRTPFAYIAYGVAILSAILLVVWLSTVIEHRKNVRLERIVSERTNELQESNAKLAEQMQEIRVLTQAINQSPVAIFITDPGGFIRYVNLHCSLLTGFTPGDLIGRAIGDMRPASEGYSTQIAVGGALERNESWSGHIALRHKDGRTVPVRSTVAPVLSEQGAILYHLYLEEDITEWLDEQQHRRRVETQLAQAQKIESVGRLAGGIAHDFNNILTGILGYCELAQMDIENRDKVSSDLNEIRSAGLRARDLVERILSFSRKNPSGQIVTDLKRPVQEALKLIRATTPATIDIAEELGSGNALADATQIHQIVVNLCTNSVHAIGDRPGKISIHLEPVEVGPKLAAEVNGLKAGDYLRLTVSDNGVGMDNATLERIFDPFFTTKPQGQGTGLGLSIVQGLVTGHGGAIHVASTVGIGTRFDLYFPAVASAVAESSAPPPPARGQGEEILVVDDEPMVANFAKACLIHHGYRPTLFDDPSQALESFQRSPERFAGIVTDLTMPHLTGLDLVKALRTKNPEMPAVIITGFGSDNCRQAIARLPRCILLQKPFDSEELARALADVMAVQKYG